MKKHVFRVDSDGYNGAWYPASAESKKGVILMLGDSAEDHMAKTAAKWLNGKGKFQSIRSFYAGIITISRFDIMYYLCA